MSNDRPDFVLQDAVWGELETRYFNGIPITLYRTEGDPSKIKGWVDNPRVDMVLNRWRNAKHRGLSSTSGSAAALSRCRAAPRRPRSGRRSRSAASVRL